MIQYTLTGISVETAGNVKLNSPFVLYGSNRIFVRVAPESLGSITDEEIDVDTGNEILALDIEKFKLEYINIHRKVVGLKQVSPAVFEKIPK